MDNVLATLKSYIETIYRDNGLLPTVLTIIAMIAILVGLSYAGVNPLAWMTGQ